MIILETISKNRKFIALVLVALIYVTLKFWFRELDNQQLIFLLAPVNFFVELFYNSSSVFSETIGYFHSELSMTINDTCSGYNFLLLTFVLSSSVVIWYGKRMNLVLTLLFTAVFSYAFTLLTNSIRVLLSIKVQNIADEFMVPRPHHFIHETIGVLVFLSFLILMYLGFNYLLKKKNFLQHEFPS
ncbi:MAG: exosortase K [Flavobacteriales bacterium]|nr:exosortase K [Flavobacteriales bacterium]